MSWTGFQEKTLWDWLDLFIVPSVLAVGGFLLNRAVQRGREQRTTDRLSEQALEAYFDRMSELILSHRLLQSQASDDVRSLARARTLSALRSLDGRRRAQVVLFLSGSKLIQSGFRAPREHTGGVINMTDADLSEVQLAGAGLGSIDLSGAIMRRANLRGANLDAANLSRTILAGADMTQLDVEWMDLTSADLTGANLRGSKLRGVFLAGAKLTGATLRGAAIIGQDVTIADLENVHEQHVNDRVTSRLRRWLRH